MALSRFHVDGTGRAQFGEEFGPLTAEDIGTGETTITPNDDEVVDPMGQ